MTSKNVLTKFFLLSTIVAGVLLSLSWNEAKSEEAIVDKRPNIIFILTDDQRFDALGFAGNTLIHTPEMDALAKTGTYFKNAMVTTPICAASRASILTGLYERTHRFTFQAATVDESYMQLSYPKLLKDNGYYTAFYGKYGVKYKGLEEQFNEYESYDRNHKYKDKRGYFYKTLGKDTVHLTRYTGQKALDFISNSETSKPFCLSLSFSAPHTHDNAKDQYFWQKETNKLLANVTIPAPNLGEDSYFESQPDFIKKGFNRLRWGWRNSTPELYQHSVKGYYRMISGIDLEIGKIRAKLKEKNLDKNTIIILLGDNGFFLGERQLSGKWLLYDNSIRVPLIVYDPRAKQARQSAAMALNIDVPSTILDFAQIDQPNSWQGKSLKPIVYGENSSLERDTVLIEHLWEFANIAPSEGVRTKDWKYFRYINDKSYEELYYLKDDPKEKINLVADKKYGSVLLKLRNKCDSLIVAKSDKYSKGPENLSVKLIESIVENNAKIVTYSWKIPKIANVQTGYQILVSSSENNINQNIGDVWDSGKINDSYNDEVPHMGSSLNNGSTYFWKVRFYDKINRLSVYSKANKFVYSM